tara:strand:- start:511 stop:1596 length:1086 start_codon:yes stop_codon:yes gene_type:complete
MTVFGKESHKNHDGVHFFNDEATGLKAIIAIHDTLLGPALGGTRLWTYQNEDEALTDVLRLSRGMTYKAACAGLSLGGGKTVILGPAPTDQEKRKQMFSAFGKAVESLSGSYITAEDVGTSVDDMVAVKKETSHVTGLPIEIGGSGDPSPFTAQGVFLGLQVAVEHQLKRKTLDDVKVLVQGIGHVGWSLIQKLRNAGASVVVTDINKEMVEKAVSELGCKACNADEWMLQNVDVYAPCALGGTLNSHTIPLLKCKVVAGAANNQLAKKEDALRLKRNGILYSPDYVINAGGLINVDLERNGAWNENLALEKVGKIAESLDEIFSRVEADDKLTTRQASAELARERLRAAAVRQDSNKNDW